MEYRTKGKELASGGRGQNKMRGNVKNVRAEDNSNGFPNFNVLNAEEKLAFFEALSEARKNIEKQGLPTRERFGTVHDEYLEYFSKDEKKETVEKKPGSASSVRPSRSPTIVRKNKEKPPAENVDRENPKQKLSLLKKFSKSPPRRLPPRPESAPVDKYESMIKRETDAVVQMYLDKKKRIEEEWRRSPPMTVSPPPKKMVRKTPKQTNEEATKTWKKTGTNDTKAETSVKPMDNSRFNSLNMAEREEFFRILKEAHDGILEKNPHTDIISLDEMLNTYKTGGTVTTVCTALKEHKTKKKNLRVNLTVTSGENERLCRSKSQIFSDSAREEVKERSKSLESLQSPDISPGKQSKIPVLKKSQSENEYCDDSDSANPTVKPSQETNITPPPTEEKKKESEEKPEKKRMILCEKIRPKEKGETKKDVESKQKVQDGNKMRTVGIVKMKMFGVDKRKSELRRAQREKEKRIAEAARKERELLRKKKMEEWRKRLQKRELMTEEPMVNKEWNKTTQTPDYRAKLIRVKKKIIPDKRVEKVPNRSTTNDDKECVKKKKKAVKDLLLEKTKIRDKWCFEDERKCEEEPPKVEIVKCPKVPKVPKVKEPVEVIKEPEDEDECVAKEMEFLKYLQDKRLKEMGETKEAEKSLRQESTKESEEECSEDERNFHQEKSTKSDEGILEEETKDLKKDDTSRRYFDAKENVEEKRSDLIQEAEKKKTQIEEEKSMKNGTKFQKDSKVQIETQENKVKEAEAKEVNKNLPEEQIKEAEAKVLNKNLPEEQIKEAVNKYTEVVKKPEEKLEEKTKEVNDKYVKNVKINVNLTGEKAKETEEKSSNIDKEVREKMAKETDDRCGPRKKILKEPRDKKVKAAEECCSDYCKELEETQKEKKAREAEERCLRRRKLQEIREKKAREAEEKYLELRKKLEEELREQNAREAEERCLRRKKLQEIREKKAREAEEKCSQLCKAMEEEEKERCLRRKKLEEIREKKAREAEEKCSQLCKAMEEEEKEKERCSRRKKLEELREKRATEKRAREADEKCSELCKTEEELLEEKVKEAEEIWLRRRKQQELLKLKAIEAEEKCSELCETLEEELEKQEAREVEKLCSEIRREFLNELKRKTARDEGEKFMKEKKKLNKKSRKENERRECLQQLQKEKEKEEEKCFREHEELKKKLAELKKEEEICERRGLRPKLHRTDSCGNVETIIAAATKQGSKSTTVLMERNSLDSENSNEEESCKESEKSFGEESELCVKSCSSGKICACGHADDGSQDTGSFVFPFRGRSKHTVRTTTQSVKSLEGVSLVEQAPEITPEDDASASKTDKTVVMDKRAVEKVKNLINYLENKVKPKENFQDEYVRLVLSYTEYLAKVTESLMQKDQKLGQQIHSTYTAHEVHLKFDDKPIEETKKFKIPRSISENELHQREIPTTSGIEKKSKEPNSRKDSTLDLLQVSDSDSSTNSQRDNQPYIPLSFKKAGIPMTKIRLLQDLLKGRAGYVEGNIDEFKVVHFPEPEFVPKEQPQTAKELTEIEEDQGEKVIRMKFFKNLIKLCRCGRKELEEDAILENLKGEAVRVDTIDEKKDPTSVTINQSTMEVLKAAERKKIIEKYFK